MYKATFDLTGKVAIVTGGGRGIGRAVAEGLAYAGANVVLTARTEEQVITAAAEIEKDTGQHTLGVPCDVTNKEYIEQAVKKVIEEFDHIEILVNNGEHQCDTEHLK